MTTTDRNQKDDMNLNSIPCESRTVGDRNYLVVEDWNRLGQNFSGSEPDRPHGFMLHSNDRDYIVTDRNSFDRINKT